MPEMPEVETVKRVLSKLLVDKSPKTIEKIEVYYSGILKEQTAEQFETILKGQTIKKIDRYGKYLFFQFDTHTIISHLRMEGKYNYNDLKHPISKHDHIVFNFTDKSCLTYNDTRKFGTMVLVKNDQVFNHKSIKKLGLEPLNSKLDALYLQTKASSKKKKIKEFLLDQTIITGLGNIYVDEVLFLSKIYPETTVDKLNLGQWNLIIQNSNQIIAQAIESGGTTVKSFAVSGDVTGLFQYNLNVYGRKGQKCPVCESQIQKIKVGGRGTHFCSQCQEIK